MSSHIRCCDPIISFSFIIILLSRIFKILASLLSPTAFALGSINFADYERAHVGLRWSNMWRVNSIISFLYEYRLLAFPSDSASIITGLIWSELLALSIDDGI